MHLPINVVAVLDVIAGQRHLSRTALVEEFVEQGISDAVHRASVILRMHAGNPPSSDS